jgi:hypothetical protein
MKVKTNLFLCWTKHRVSKACGGLKYSSVFFLASTPYCDVLSSTPQLLYPRERARSTSFARRFGKSHSRYKRCGEKKMPPHLLGIESRIPIRPVHSLVTILMELKLSKTSAKKSRWSMRKRIRKEKGNCWAEEIRRQKRSKIRSSRRRKGLRSRTRVEWQEMRRNENTMILEDVSSKAWCHLTWWICTNNSWETAASTFRVKEEKSSH